MYLPRRNYFECTIGHQSRYHVPGETAQCSRPVLQLVKQFRGKYSNNSIDPSITECSATQTIGDHGCATTKLCPEGTFCNGTTPKPVPCPPGETTEFRGMASCSKCSVGKKGTGNGCQSCPGNSIAKFPGRTTCDECEQGRYATPEKTFCRDETLGGNAPIVQLVLANGNRLAVAWNAKDFSNGNATLTVMDKETQGNKYSRSRFIGLISPILLAPLPLASRVYQVQIQVRYANTSSPKSNLVYQGNAWKITSDCTDLQYLQTGDKDMTKWACKSCPEGASCAGSITQYGIKARFGWWRERRPARSSSLVCTGRLAWAHQTHFWKPNTLMHEPTATRRAIWLFSSRVDCARRARKGMRAERQTARAIDAIPFKTSSSLFLP